MTSWTWFGHEHWKVHGIQLIPITPVIYTLFSPNFVQSAYKVYDRVCEKDPNCAKSGFNVFAIAEQVCTRAV